MKDSGEIIFWKARALTKMKPIIFMKASLREAIMMGREL
jgi:hypothetical protein